MTHIIIGKCSLCGGHVGRLKVWMGTQPQTDSCLSCRAFRDDLPVIKMTSAISNKPDVTINDLFGKLNHEKVMQDLKKLGDDILKKYSNDFKQTS